MQTEVKTWLFDILNAIHEIESFLAETRTFESYRHDTKTKRAVESNLEIIGEAMNRIVNRDDSIQLSHSRKIISTRNRIIHGYDSVSDEIIWSIVETYLPVLSQEVSNLLAEE